MIVRSVIISLVLLLTLGVQAGLAGGAPCAAPVETVELMAGTPYATQAYIYQARIRGPAIMVVGGVHGDEPAGSLAAEEIRRLAVERGTLIVIPRVNNLALAANQRTLPEITDVNRAYPGRKDGNPAQRIAYEIGVLMEEYQVSLLIDLHEGRTFHMLDKTSVGQSILYGIDDKSTVLALEAVEHINRQIKEKHKKFTFLATPIQGSTAYYASVHLNIPAFTVETSKEQPLADRVSQHVGIVTFMLAAEGLITQ